MYIHFAKKTSSKIYHVVVSAGGETEPICGITDRMNNDECDFSWGRAFMSDYRMCKKCKERLNRLLYADNRR